MNKFPLTNAFLNYFESMDEVEEKFHGDEEVFYLVRGYWPIQEPAEKDWYRTKKEIPSAWE